MSTDTIPALVTDVAAIDWNDLAAVAVQHQIDGLLGLQTGQHPRATSPETGARSR
jgi:hypothetical protein